jgi:murein L,D-transpeptidase YafK
MKKILNLIWFSLFVLQTACAQDENRVKIAKDYAENKWIALLKEKQISYPPAEVFVRIFKEEAELEIWGKNKNQSTFTLLKNIPICRMSGELGPKRKRGDNQVPEGFYEIDYFNEKSNFFLSVKINYPNYSDRILGFKDPGNNICIHGSCVSVGCVSIEDDPIKEFYWLMLKTKISGVKFFPVHIFPFKFSNVNEKQWTEKNNSLKMHDFWKNIKQGYDFFETNKKLPKFTIGKDGKYNFSDK